MMVDEMAARSAASMDNLMVDLMDVTTAAWLVDTMVVTMAATLVVDWAVCLVDQSVAGWAADSADPLAGE